MFNIICFFIGHKWSNWKYIKPVGRYDEKLRRDCKRCKNQDFYTGLTELDKTGNKIPQK